MQEPILKEVLIAVILELHLKKSEQTKLLAKLSEAFERPSRVMSEEEKLLRSETNRALWEQNRVEARFRVEFEGYQPKEVDGYAALAVALGISESSARRKVYQGSGNFSGRNKSGEIYNVIRLTRTTYKGRGDSK